MSARVPTFGHAAAVDVSRLTPATALLCAIELHRRARSIAALTVDHDEIRSWVEEHDGKPASVRGTEEGDEAGVLRIDFPGGAGEDRLEHISWDEWLAKFDENELAFLYQQERPVARTAPSSSSSRGTRTRSGSPTRTGAFAVAIVMQRPVTASPCGVARRASGKAAFPTWTRG
jgi:hypothetical protein